MRPYGVPSDVRVRWLASMLLMRQRNLNSDAAELLRDHPTAVYGIEHVPRAGRFVLVMNHCERAGWPALLASTALAQKGGETTPVWLITDRFYGFRLRGLRLPALLVGRFLARVAARYRLILVARPQVAAMGRAIALRQARRLLEGRDPRPIASTPKGERAIGTSLARPVPTSGKALALSHSEIPIVPVAVYEDAAGRLMARFGNAFTLPWPSVREARRTQDALADTIMVAIAACLPLAMRGPYCAATAATDGHST